MTGNDLDRMVNQIRDTATTADQATREKLVNKLRNLAVDLETPAETVQRVLYPAILPALCRVGIKLDLFEILSKSDGPITTTELAGKTKCDPVLMSRILRYLASSNTITETDQDTFAANHVTKILAKPGIRAGLNHQFETVGPAYQALPAFFEATKYANPDNSYRTPLQMGHNTELPVFDWFGANPNNLGFFMEWMPAQREGMATWLDEFPMTQETKGMNPESVLFVDIGGGIGHQCAALKARYPTLPGRVILQDRPETLLHALPTKGVEALEHDFFKPQPIKGAKFYYMRNILHDWPDDKCVDILSQLSGAMGPDSFLLIDEMVLPSKGASLQAMQIDMTMLAGLSSMERTEKQWTALLDSAGFQVTRTVVYTESLRDSVLVCVPKKK